MDYQQTVARNLLNWGAAHIVDIETGERWVAYTMFPGNPKKQNIVAYLARRGFITRAGYRYWGHKVWINTTRMEAIKEIMIHPLPPIIWTTKGLEPLDKAIIGRIIKFPGRTIKEIIGPFVMDGGLETTVYRHALVLVNAGFLTTEKIDGRLHLYIAPGVVCDD